MREFYMFNRNYAISIAALTAFFLASTSAFATDLKGSSKDGYNAFADVKTYNWTGVYLGAQLGYGHTVFGDEDGQGGLDLNGLIGGIRGGIDVQRGAAVFGLFGEYNWSDQALEVGGLTALEQTDDWSVNARLGVAHGPTLFYAAGGYGQYGFESPIFGGASETLDGWNARLGIEHQVSQNFTIGLEAMRIWLDLSEIAPDLEDVISSTDDRLLVRGTWRVNSSIPGLN
jgi:outer membrane immunogenic protein